jgi:hypothetical protein
MALKIDFPHQNHYVPPPINSRYFLYFNVLNLSLEKSLQESKNESKKAGDSIEDTKGIARILL